MLDECAILLVPQQRPQEIEDKNGYFYGAKYLIFGPSKFFKNFFQLHLVPDLFGCGTTFKFFLKLR
jgi:hypothetical protein